MRAVLVLVALAGACGPTSYEKATVAHPVGPDRWVIEVSGKRIDAGLTLEYQQRKAAEVCPSGFTVEQTSGGEETKGYIVNGNTATPIKRTDAAAVVRCH